NGVIRLLQVPDEARVPDRVHAVAANDQGGFNRAERGDGPELHQFQKGLPRLLCPHASPEGECRCKPERDDTGPDREGKPPAGKSDRFAPNAWLTPSSAAGSRGRGDSSLHWTTGGYPGRGAGPGRPPLPSTPP